MMPIVFLFSAIVSGIAAVLLLYIVDHGVARARRSTCACVDTIARYLFYAFLIDFSLEMLDLIHRIYEADESFRSLDFMVQTRLFVSQIVLQIVRRHAGADRPPCRRRRLCGCRRGRASARIYTLAASLTLVGIFAMRWNVVIGGQLFSKSFLGYTTYKMEFATREGLLPAILVMVLPFVILAVLIHFLPPWGAGSEDAATGGGAHAAQRV